MSAGVLSGLQHQYEGLGASWVGSIPTHSRQVTLMINDNKLLISIKNSDSDKNFYLKLK